MAIATPFWISLLAGFAAYFLYAGINRRSKQQASRSAVQQRMEAFARQSSMSAVEMDPDQVAAQDAKPGFMRRLGEQLTATSLEGRHGRSLIEYLDHQLELAGYPNGWTVPDFIARYVMMVGGAVVGGGVMVQTGTFPVYLYLPLVLMCAAYPNVWLKKRIEARKEQAFAELPYFLDELVLGLSSGAATLDQAIRGVVIEDSLGTLRDSQRVLVREFRRAYLETASQSRPREEAYRAAAERIRVQEVDDLVETLIEGFNGSETTLYNLKTMSVHVYKVFEQNMATLIKKKDTPFTVATVVIMFSTAILIATPIMITVLRALSGGGF